MRKNRIGIVSAFLIAVLSFALLMVGCETKTQDDSVLFTYNGKDYTRSYADQAIQQLAADKYIDDISDYRAGINLLVKKVILEDYFQKEGIKEYTASETEAFRSQAQELMDEALNSFVDLYLIENPGASEEEGLQLAEEYYRNLGYNTDVLMQQLAYYSRTVRLSEKIITISEDEIKNEYDNRVTAYQETYGENAPTCELHRDFYGEEILSLPQGYRGILHIQLKSKDSQLEADTEGAREAIFAERQQDIDAIYARLSKGESFETLIAEYGEDPYMEEALETGYPIHQESITYDPELVEAAFGEKMKRPGDVSDPVVTSSGIHILYYKCDLHAGPVEMSEAMRASIRSELLDLRLEELVESEAKEHVQYNETAIRKAASQFAA